MDVASCEPGVFAVLDVDERKLLVMMELTPLENHICAVIYSHDIVTAMTDGVDEALGRAGFEKKSIEGYATRRWVLMDYGDVVIHVFNSEDRLFYDLERIWRDGKRVTAAELDQ